MTHSRRTRATLAMVVAAGALAGCVTTTTRVYQPQPAGKGGAPPAPMSPLAVSACASRLQDICGALLLYFQERHRLPDTLDQLQPLNQFGPPLQFVCPTDGKPYIYDPAAVQGDPDGRWILAYDASPVHEGHRWVILARPPEGRQPVSMWVVSLDEATFQRLKAATTQPAPVAPTQPQAGPVVPNGQNVPAPTIRQVPVIRP